MTVKLKIVNNSIHDFYHKLRGDYEPTRYIYFRYQVERGIMSQSRVLYVKTEIINQLEY